MRLPDNRVGVIAGATGFLGGLLARHYAKLGTDVILIGKDEIKLRNLKRELESIADTKVTVVSLDFEASYISELSAIIENFTDQIDFFISTIGSQHPISPVLLSEDHDWSASIQTNLILPVSLAKFFAGVFYETGQGSIILTSGGGATNGRANFSAYASAKAGLVRFVETFAAELVESNVRINAIAPGVMPSKMMDEIAGSSALSAGKDEVEKAQEVLDMKVWDPALILSLCDFLVSEESKGISGKLISAEWDNWREWPRHVHELRASDLYTLRRITGRERGQSWGDV
jgi:NAD(P)-dependent dehydrogenase (short-subunit alcohol dehydrogenase family)